MRTIAWFATLTIVTAGLVHLRTHLDKAHVVLAYLLMVLAASSIEGRAVGLSLATTSFLAFNYYLLPPYHRFVVADSRDWFVLLAYLVTAAVAAELLHRARRHAATAASLVQADRYKDALLASVSHDLRAPLTTIKAVAYELRKNGAENAEIIESEADRLNQFVVDLLDMSAINAGALRPRPELNAADDLLSSALERLAGHPRAADIDASIDSAELLLGTFDFSHSLRALVNLVDNALKYSPANSRVTVRARRVHAQLVFEVTDSGRGLDESQQLKIFEPFYRANGAEPDATGAGLGLPIAQRMARAQGGDVTFSTPEEGGSCFSLLLPAADLPPDFKS